MFSKMKEWRIFWKGNLTQNRYSTQRQYTKLLFRGRLQEDMHKPIIQLITMKSSKVICVCTVCSFVASLKYRYFVQLLNLTLPRPLYFPKDLINSVTYCSLSILCSAYIVFSLHFEDFPWVSLLSGQFHCYLVLVFLLCTEAHHEQIQRSERKAKENLNPHSCLVFT